MPSTPQPIIVPGKRYHIYNRAAARQDVFIDDTDFVHFLNLTRRFLPPVMDLLAYALLPNHFHLYVRVYPLEQLSIFFQQKTRAIGNFIGHLQNAYAKYFRAKNNSVGKGVVFQGWYKRKEVDTSSYRREIVHYLNKNAVHHGLVGKPDEYPFTSLQELLYDEVEPFVNRALVYQDFGGKAGFLRQSNDRLAYSKLDGDLEWL